MMKKLYIFADIGKFIKEFFLFLKRRKRWWLAPRPPPRRYPS